MPELAAHLERVARNIVERIVDDSAEWDGATEVVAAALAACAREAANDEFTWAIDALKDMGHLDIAFKLLARHAALERAAGEKA